MSGYFDVRALLEEYGDDMLVRELAQLLVENLPSQIEAIQSAVAAGDGPALRAAAHRLRGSLVPFGMAAAVEMARELESIGVSGALAGAQALSERLEQEVQLLRDGASAWLAGA